MGFAYRGSSLQSGEFVMSDILLDAEMREERFPRWNPADRAASSTARSVRPVRSREPSCTSSGSIEFVGSRRSSTAETTAFMSASALRIK